MRTGVLILMIVFTRVVESIAEKMLSDFTPLLPTNMIVTCVGISLLMAYIQDIKEVANDS